MIAPSRSKRDPGLLIRRHDVEFQIRDRFQTIMMGLYAAPFVALAITLDRRFANVLLLIGMFTWAHIGERRRLEELRQTDARLARLQASKTRRQQRKLRAKYMGTCTRSDSS